MSREPCGACEAIASYSHNNTLLAIPVLWHTCDINPLWRQDQERPRIVVDSMSADGHTGCCHEP